MSSDDDDLYNDPDELAIGRYVDWVCSQHTNSGGGSASSTQRSSSSHTSSSIARYGGNYDWKEYQIQHEKLAGQLPSSVLQGTSGSSLMGLGSGGEEEPGSDDGHDYDDEEEEEEEGAVEWVSLDVVC